jgi:pre-mRNA-splicing factor CDC5/CEF1
VSFVPEKNARELQKVREAEQLGRRRKLVLPAPQIGDSELQEIVKIGMAGEQARDMAQESENAATQSLMGDYNPVGMGIAARTPRTPAAADTVAIEARNLRAMTAAQTPLLGEENAAMAEPDAGTGFEGVTPRKSVAQTPNPMLTPLRAAAGAATATQTPFRDELSINTPCTVPVGASPRELRMEAVEQQRPRTTLRLCCPRPRWPKTRTWRW